MRWELIESDDALAGILAREGDCPAVAIDTEFMRRNTFYPQVALLQLCFSDTAWLVDPLALDSTGPLRRLLQDASTVKVLHSASEDLEVFQHWLGVLPEPLFDTQKAAALLDRGFGLGYRALVQQMFDVDLPKGETRSDWLQRPLTASQCEYAAQDVAHLLPIWEELQGDCERAGKLDWVLQEGRSAAQGLASTAGGYYRRIKSAWKLSPRQLAALIAVSDWRELTARERDKPRSWIIDDKACLALAQALPDDRADLARLDLPQAAVRRYGAQWLEMLQEVQELSDGELPAPLPAPLPPSSRDGMKRLKQRARAIAADLRVAPEILLPSKEFELLLREAAGEAVAVPDHWHGWRSQTVIEPLRSSLSGSNK